MSIGDGWSSGWLKHQQRRRVLRVAVVDCEMCTTTKGLELTRVTVVSAGGRVIYDTLVRPAGAVIDYHTQYSGLTEDIMRRV